MNALKKTVLDIRWMLLIAILGPVGSFLVSRDVQTIIPVLLVEVVVAFPIAYRLSDTFTTMLLWEEK